MLLVIQHKVARLARRFATTRRIQRLSNHLFTVARVLFKELQESYDNSGLIVGDVNGEVHRALLCLDSTEAVVDEAIAKGHMSLTQGHFNPNFTFGKVQYFATIPFFHYIKFFS